jgi:putative ABC transport system ATP-binding protein
MLPQVMAPIAELSTLENVALPLRLAGTSWTEARARAATMLGWLDLTAEADRPATEASMGQQQRMALARAAVIRPIVLLADEPTSHQDGGHTDTLLTMLRRLVDEGTCAVVASHDPAVADAADRVLDLDR